MNSIELMHACSQGVNIIKKITNICITRIFCFILKLTAVF